MCMRTTGDELWPSKGASQVIFPVQDNETQEGGGGGGVVERKAQWWLQYGAEGVYTMVHGRWKQKQKQPLRKMASLVNKAYLQSRAGLQPRKAGGAGRPLPVERSPRGGGACRLPGPVGECLQNAPPSSLRKKRARGQSAGLPGALAATSDLPRFPRWPRLLLHSHLNGRIPPPPAPGRGKEAPGAASA